jgi:hypothetical protein
MYCRQRRHTVLWWSNLEILFAPLHRSSPFTGGLRCQAIQTEHGPYIAERIQKAVYIVICLWTTLDFSSPKLLEISFVTLYHNVFILPVEMNIQYTLYTDTVSVVSVADPLPDP